MFRDGSGVRAGAGEKFPNAKADEPIGGNSGRSQIHAPIRSDAQILVAGPVEPGHLLDNGTERRVGHGKRTVFQKGVCVNMERSFPVRHMCSI